MGAPDDDRGRAVGLYAIPFSKRRERPTASGSAASKPLNSLSFRARSTGLAWCGRGRSRDAGRGEPVEADAIVSTTPGLAVGIVTADCVPILVASRDGSRVGAIHAGWRGLAAGVIEAGIEAMDVDVSGLVAAVGPAARGCCYEVDEPVAEALAVRYAALLQEVLVPGRSGHLPARSPPARVLASCAGSVWLPTGSGRPTGSARSARPGLVSSPTAGTVTGPVDFGISSNQPLRPARPRMRP